MNNKRGKLNIWNEYCNEIRKVCFLLVSNGYRNTCYNFQIKSDSFNKDFIIPVNGSNNDCISWQDKFDIHKSNNDNFLRFKIQNCTQTMQNAGQLCTCLIMSYFTIFKWCNSYLIEA